MISPEGASSILWRTADRASDAADAMKITAADLQRAGVVDRVVPEPLGGAHRGRQQAVAALGEVLGEELDALRPLDRDELRRQRRAKFLAIG